MKRSVITIILLFALLLTAISTVACDQGTTDGAASTSDKDEEAKEYTVTFVTNGGSAVSKKTVTEVSSSPTTTKSGHVFLGWYDGKDLTSAISFPLKPEKDMTLYAKWLKVEDSLRCEDTVLKNWSGFHSSSTYMITPPSFDKDALEANDYIGMTITVTYKVSYQRDYDFIGYAGAPEYDVLLSTSAGPANSKSDLNAPSSITARTISLSTTLTNLENGTVKVKFSTANIQNIVYIDDIVVTYKCYK